MSKPNIVKRGGAKPIGNVTQGISARLCGKFKHLRYGRLFTEWKQIFPDEVGLLYRPFRLTGTKLWVQTSSTQAALLTYFAPSMVERINQYLGNDVVESIHSQNITTQHAQNLRKPKLNALSDESKEHIVDIPNQKLKEALEQWGQWLEAREP